MMTIGMRTKMTADIIGMGGSRIDRRRLRPRVTAISADLLAGTKKTSGGPAGRGDDRASGTAPADPGGASGASTEGRARGRGTARPRCITTTGTTIIVDTSVTPSLVAASSTSSGLGRAAVSADDGCTSNGYSIQPGTMIGSINVRAVAPAACALHAQRISAATASAHGASAACVAGPTKEDGRGRNAARPRVSGPRTTEGTAVVDRLAAAARDTAINHDALTYLHR